MTGSIPSPSSNVLHLGPLSVHVHGLMDVVAVIAAIVDPAHHVLGFRPSFFVAAIPSSSVQGRALHGPPRSPARSVQRQRRPVSSAPMSVRPPLTARA